LGFVRCALDEENDVWNDTEEAELVLLVYAVLAVADLLTLPLAVLFYAGVGRDE
jgi:hypothetical protein